jgi:hypothetical protein
MKVHYIIYQLRRDHEKNSKILNKSHNSCAELFPVRNLGRWKEQGCGVNGGQWWAMVGQASAMLTANSNVYGFLFVFPCSGLVQIKTESQAIGKRAV